MSHFPGLPVQASTFAHEVDNIYIFMLAISFFFTALVVGLVIFFSIKYRKRDERIGLERDRGGEPGNRTFLLHPVGGRPLRNADRVEQNQAGGVVDGVRQDAWIQTTSALV